MGRPIYPHELSDPDFSWLISSFKESHPNYQSVEIGLLPIVLIQNGDAIDFEPCPSTFFPDREEQVEEDLL